MVVRENSELASHFDTANWRKSLEAAVKAAVHGASLSNNARLAGPSGGGDANHADDSIPQRAASVTSTLSLPLTGPRPLVRSALSLHSSYEEQQCYISHLHHCKLHIY